MNSVENVWSLFETLVHTSSVIALTMPVKKKKKKKEEQEERKNSGKFGKNTTRIQQFILNQHFLKRDAQRGKKQGNKKGRHGNY